MIVLDSTAVSRLLPMKECIAFMREAMRSVSQGQTDQMLRQIMSVPGGIYGVMGGTTPSIYGAKLISAVKPQDHASAPSHQGLVVLFAPETGAPVAIIDATSLTAIRTAATSAMATQELSREGACTLAILGTGEQALMHARAICLVRPIGSISLWGRDKAKAEKLAGKLRDELAAEIRTVDTVAEAARDVEIVCTVTSATEPFLGAAEISPGTHINAVGSSHLGQREIRDSLVASARFYGDSRESVVSQGAEFVHARDAGLISDAYFLGEIGEVISGQCPGRRSAEEVTLYKSLGHIVQDLVAGWQVYRLAIEAGEGQVVNM